MATQEYLSLGNRVMRISTIALLLAITAAYPLAHHIALVLQIVAHLSIAVAAAAFKLGYVMRLAAQQELSRLVT